MGEGIASVSYAGDSIPVVGFVTVQSPPLSLVSLVCLLMGHAALVSQWNVNMHVSLYSSVGEESLKKYRVRIIQIKSLGPIPLIILKSRLPQLSLISIRKGMIIF